jgi:mono/diheme cytochrome c family protein
MASSMIGGGVAADAAAAEVGVEATTEVSEGAMNAMQRQLATAGRKAVEKTIRTLTKNIGEHEARMAEYRAAGGNVSSMEAEVSAWRQTIEAARRVLEANK